MNGLDEAFKDEHIKEAGEYLASVKTDIKKLYRAQTAYQKRQKAMGLCVSGDGKKVWREASPYCLECRKRLTGYYKQRYGKKISTKEIVG